MNDCIFCKIVNKELSSEIFYEDEKFIVFDDISPKAPVHKLIVPKIHIESVDKLDDGNISMMSDITKIAKKIAKETNVTGYTLSTNVGKDAGQIVFHLHVHFLGYKNG